MRRDDLRWTPPERHRLHRSYTTQPASLDAAPALELFPYPGLGMALVASAYELAKQLLTWEVTSTYDFAEKVIKYQRSSLR